MNKSSRYKFQSLIGIICYLNSRILEPLSYLVFEVHLRESTLYYNKPSKNCNTLSKKKSQNPYQTKLSDFARISCQTRSPSNPHPQTISTPYFPPPLLYSYPSAQKSSYSTKNIVSSLTSGPPIRSTFPWQHWHKK